MVRNVCAKSDRDRLRINKALGIIQLTDNNNNNNNNNFRSDWGRFWVQTRRSRPRNTLPVSDRCLGRRFRDSSLEWPSSTYYVVEAVPAFFDDIYDVVYGWPRAGRRTARTHHAGCMRLLLTCITATQCIYARNPTGNCRIKDLKRRTSMNVYERKKRTFMRLVKRTCKTRRNTWNSNIMRQVARTCKRSLKVWPTEKLKRNVR